MYKMDEPSGPLQTTWWSQILSNRVRAVMVQNFIQRDMKNAGQAFPQTVAQPGLPFPGCSPPACLVRPGPLCNILLPALRGSLLQDRRPQVACRQKGADRK